MKEIIESIVDVENSTEITIEQLKEIADKTPAEIDITEVTPDELYMVCIDTDDDHYDLDLISNKEEVKQLCAELEIELEYEE